MIEAMMIVEEFRTGHVSLPAIDTDDLPSCCFACPYLFAKEISVGEEVAYLWCGYLMTERTRNLTRPVCVIE